MIDIIMPKMGDGMEEGVILRWIKKPGDKIENGDTLAEVETDKASVDLPSDAEGTLVEILVGEGQSAPVGGVIAHLGSADQVVLQTPSAVVDLTVESAKAPMQAAPVGPEKPADPNDRRKPRLVASPLAKRIAADNGIDLNLVVGTGPAGRIVERDVQQAMQQAKTKPSSAVRGVTAAAAEPGHKIVQPMSRMRKLIAERTTQTKQAVPHFYVSMSIDMGAVMKLRTLLNEAAEEQTAKLSIGDFVTKATSLALSKHQPVNALYEDDAIVYCEDINIGIAVALPDGLIIPVIKQCQRMGLRELSAETKRLAESARNGKILPDEMTDATFNISNLGMYGVDDFVAIISPPSVAILAVGGIHKRLELDEDDQTVVRNIMQVTVSADHRALNGADVAQFLNTFKNLLENPYKLL